MHTCREQLPKLERSLVLEVNRKRVLGRILPGPESLATRKHHTDSRRCLSNASFILTAVLTQQQRSRDWTDQSGGRCWGLTWWCCLSSVPYIYTKYNLFTTCLHLWGFSIGVFPLHHFTILSIPNTLHTRHYLYLYLTHCILVLSTTEKHVYLKHICYS